MSALLFPLQISLPPLLLHPGRVQRGFDWIWGEWIKLCGPNFKS